MSKINCVIVVTRVMHYDGQAVVYNMLYQGTVDTHTHTVVRSLKYIKQYPPQLRTS